MRLKDRNKPIPGGYRYYQPETNFFPTPHSSFDSCVVQIIKHRAGNPWLVEKNGWSVDPQAVAAELDAYNTKVCAEMGWSAYIADGEPGDPKVPFLALPPTIKSSLSKIGHFGRNVAEGASVIAEWEISGGKIVSQEQAEARAGTCVKCPKNVGGDLLSFFTKQAASLITLQLESKNNMKLSTSLDLQLGICDACGCVNKLKIWCPLDIIQAKIKPETKAALHSDCWIIHEQEPVLSSP